MCGYSDGNFHFFSYGHLEDNIDPILKVWYGYDKYIYIYNFGITWYNYDVFMIYQWWNVGIITITIVYLWDITTMI